MPLPPAVADGSGIRTDGGAALDSGAAGAGRSDAGAADAGALDAGDAVPDAGLSDAGVPDAGGSDAGPSIWTPAPGTTWHWQLDQPVDTSPDVAMYDVDLFDTPRATLDALRADGRIVVCYFSAGSREDWRPDADAFPSADLGNPLDGWPGERWVRVSSPAVREVMRARLDLAVHKGCDGVEPDNVDGYANGNGLGITAAEQLDYNRFLASEAHARGLSVGLKNDLDQVLALEPDFDWALNESCLEYSECGRLQPFLDAGKAVFHVEYVDRRSQGEARAAQVCVEPTRAGFSTLIKLWGLDAWQISCP